MGVRIQKDMLRFPVEKGDDLPRDLKLKVRAKILDTNSLGKFSGNFNLIVPEAPRYLLTRNSEVWFEGEIIGHMKVDSNVATFGTRKQYTGGRKTMSISCTAPLTPSVLQVASSNKYITARLVLPSKLKPDENVDATKPNNVAKLEMILSPNAPIGQQNGKVVVTNTVNKERIEIRVYATIIK
jgi:hypothetical protein